MSVIRLEGGTPSQFRLVNGGEPARVRALINYAAALNRYAAFGQECRPDVARTWGELPAELRDAIMEAYGHITRRKA